MNHKFKFPTRFVSQEMLDAEAAERDQVQTCNRNVFSMEFCMRWNMNNCQRFLSPYDYIWGGKFR